MKQLLAGSIWDIIETYDAMVGLLRGQLESRLVPKAFYGLKQINQHKPRKGAKGCIYNVLGIHNIPLLDRDYGEAQEQGIVYH